MPKQIQGSQRDFSFGEIDVDLKRNDDHPARKAGLRQMVNARIRNSGTIQNRSGRRALFPSTQALRIEKFTIAAGHNYKIAFGNVGLFVIDNTETVIFGSAVQASGAALPWTTATLKNIVYTVFGQTVVITFPNMRPQVLTWNGVNGFALSAYTELVIGNQKRTPFYRISPQGVTLKPTAQTGAINLNAVGANVFSAASVGTRIRWVNRQILITGFVNPVNVTALVEEALPAAQNIAFGVAANTVFSVGDIVVGSISGSKGIVADDGGGGATMAVQLLTTSTSTSGGATGRDGSGSGTTAFLSTDTVVGPGGAMLPSAVSGLLPPLPCALWDEEVMNDLRGYPASCFNDQFRLGFCNFPAIPGGICWSAINSPTDIFVGPNPADAMFEIAPAKTQVLYVVPGPESSEFVFCTDRLYYIPISPTNPLRPGSVGFQILSGDGAAQVQPRLAQEAILYVNAGQNSMMAIIATGAFLRPFNTKNLSDFHSHLFESIVAIAAPNADGTFNERYAYVLNGDGSIAVGRYDPSSLAGNQPVIGWGPWEGGGAVNWISAWNADVFFTSAYFGTGICEVLDDTKYLDCSLSVNALPTAFTPPVGKGPLWFIPGQTVTLMDQVTRFMGTYQIDANGFIVPQFNGGEDLTLASLVAGQPWTMTAEPFCPDAQPGADMHQRMTMRQIANFGVSFINSTGFLFALLFCQKQTKTSPPLGTIVNTRRVPMWNQDDDATKPPTLRESMEFYPPQVSAYDPRVAIIKDSPGPLEILEIAMEISL